jgi:DNA-binding response OmpR family regulator
MATVEGRRQMTIVAVVEDDAHIRAAVTRGLTERGHVVLGASTGLGGLADIVEQRPDLVVLDLGLPDIDGLELLRMLRAVSAVPVIVATARDDEREIIRTLDAGADEYVVKPYSAHQLDARIRAVLRRVKDDDADAPVQIGGLAMDARSRVATIDGKPMDLSRKEFDLLWHLAARQGEVVSKRELLAAVWRQPYGGPEKTIDVHLSWLRSKLGESAREPRYLRSVRGVGVMLVDPDAS